MATDARQAELNEMRITKQKAMYAAIIELASKPGQEKLRAAMENTEIFVTTQPIGRDLTAVLLFPPTVTKGGNSFGYAASPRRAAVAWGWDDGRMCGRNATGSELRKNGIPTDDLSLIETFPFKHIIAAKDFMQKELEDEYDTNAEFKSIIDKWMRFSVDIEHTAFVEKWNAKRVGCPKRSPQKHI